MPHAMIEETACGTRSRARVHTCSRSAAPASPISTSPGFTDEMAKHFTVIDTDQIGNGHSDKPERKYTIDSWADEVAELLDLIGIERTHVHSSSTVA